MSVMPNAYHTPVLTQQVVDGLRVEAGGSYIDCTVGEGGHSLAILQASSPGGRILGIDLDPQALETAEVNLDAFRDLIILTNDNFSNLSAIAMEHGFYPVDGVILDLGLSSLQLEGEDRGFSFRSEDRLDMRFDPNQEITAWEIVNCYPEKELTRIINTYGEEHRADRIAKKITENRPIDTSLQLASVVASTPGHRWRRTHPATNTFQAIRMEVNGEQESLDMALSQAVSILRSGGRLVVISYHSLEDRMVKYFFRHESAEVKNVRVITKKVISPSREEVLTNKRSRSARMRVAERI